MKPDRWADAERINDKEEEEEPEERGQVATTAVVGLGLRNFLLLVHGESVASAWRRRRPGADRNDCQTGFKFFVGEFSDELGRILGICLRPDHAALRAKAGCGTEVKCPGAAQGCDEPCHEVVGLKAEAFGTNNIAVDELRASAEWTLSWSGHGETIADTGGLEQ